MTQPVSRRMPVSCEPCRARKIRCSPSSNPAEPCGSCVRRGLSPSQCVYLRYMHGRDAPDRHRSAQPPTTVSTTSNDELLDRIRALEDIVRSQGCAYCGNTAESSHGIVMPVTPITHPSPSVSSQPVNSSPIGSLRTYAGGYQLFEPYGSLWKSVLHSLQSPASGLGLEDDTDLAAADLPFNLDNGVSVDDLISQLPPHRQCEDLKNVFLDVFAPLFHILHNPTFESQYAKFQSDSASMPLSWLALLYAILAVAVTSLDESTTLLFDLARKPTRSQCIAHLTTRYRKMAMQCLQADQFLWRHTIATLQALVILIYGINHTHGRAWVMLGTSYNIAVGLGCHIDPENFQLTAVEQEERRRCWAGLVMLYTIQLTSMGCLDQHIIVHNVKLPMDVNDDDIPRGTIQPANTQRPTQMSYILHKFRLYEICAKVCRSVFRPERPSYDSILAIEQEIYSEQKRWETCYIVHSRRYDLPIHHEVHMNILYGYSHQLILLLHRPMLIRAGDHSDTNLNEINNSRMCCISSATSLLQIHEMLHQSTAFASFRWYNEGLGSFHAFHAFVVLVALLTTMENTMQVFEIKEKLRTSFTVFDALSERSRVCEKALPILRYLLTLYVDIPAQQDQRYSINTNSDSSFDAIMKSLEPQQWLNPSSIEWQNWDTIINT